PSPPPPPAVPPPSSEPCLSLTNSTKASITLGHAASASYPCSVGSLRQTSQNSHSIFHVSLATLRLHFVSQNSAHMFAMLAGQRLARRSFQYSRAVSRGRDFCVGGRAKANVKR